MHRLEQHYNDGQRYILHYVTAREAYTLAMAAADGKRGDPRQYYDDTIGPYEADPGRHTSSMADRSLASAG